MPPPNRKRPLILKSNTNNLSNAPRPQSTIRLEKLLDGTNDSNKKKRRKAATASGSKKKGKTCTNHESTRTTTQHQQQALVNNRFSKLVQHSMKKTNDITLSSLKGGLCSAPGYKKVMVTSSNKSHKIVSSSLKSKKLPTVPAASTTGIAPGSDATDHRLPRSTGATRVAASTLQQQHCPKSLPPARSEREKVAAAIPRKEVAPTAPELNQQPNSSAPHSCPDRSTESAAVTSRITTTITKDAQPSSSLKQKSRDEAFFQRKPRRIMDESHRKQLRRPVVPKDLSSTDDNMNASLSSRKMTVSPLSTELSSSSGGDNGKRDIDDVPLIRTKTQHPPGDNTAPSPSTNKLAVSLSSSSSSFKKKKQPTTNNDNFVRLNLRNSAGACRGARNKKRPWRGGGSGYSNKFQRSWKDEQEDEQQASPGKQNSQTYPNHGGGMNNSHHTDPNSSTTSAATSFHSNRSSTSSGNSSSTQQHYGSRRTGLDPMDEFLDGSFHPKDEASGNKSEASQQRPKSKKMNETGPPLCTRHQRPCKLLVVKSNAKGNKGRKFYVCSMPRGEDCNHFQWEDDTMESARKVLSKNGSHSTFVARQVAAHVDRLRMLTVPELRVEAAKRNLNKDGKKQQLLTRLAIWIRDEVAKSTSGLMSTGEIVSSEMKKERKNDDSCIPCIELDDDSDSESESSDDGELSISEEDSPGGETDVEVSVREAATPPTLDTPEAVMMSVFGHVNFRDGQKWAIERCLAGEKSLLVAPTGFGKSLCYAVPAAMLEGITVVVSPLISLIQDQLRSLPPRIPAATLSGSLSAATTAATLDDIVRNRIKILFVSPERLASASFRRLFRYKWNPATKQRERRFPVISLLCVDEAHCVSQWAHNFRPCFLRFQKMLHLMSPKSVLAITATAGPRVMSDISEALDISSSLQVPSDRENPGVKVISKPRDNIDVASIPVADREQQLSMLSSILTKNTSKDSYRDDNPYVGALCSGSVIIYVWRQKDTEAVAENLIAAGVSGGVVIYHGGMDANARKKSQSRFMRGKARICVATVAFGLGIDKADVVGIIHLYASNSPEHYLQEIGRAGRDGRAAQAIALAIRDDLPTRHSLAHSSLISKAQIRCLLLSIRDLVLRSFAVLAEDSDSERTINIGLPVHALVIGCDCKAETVETLLSLIPKFSETRDIVEVEGFNYDRGVIALKKRALAKLAESEEVAACILAVGEENTDMGATNRSMDGFQRQFLAYSLGSYTFSVAQAANKLGADAEPRHVFAALRRLETTNELELALDTKDTGRVIHIKVPPEGCRFFRSSTFEDDIHALENSLFLNFNASVKTVAQKVIDMQYILDCVAASNDESSESPSLDSKLTPGLIEFQSLTKRYFAQSQSSFVPEGTCLIQDKISKIQQNELESDILWLLQNLPSLLKKAPPSVQEATFGEARMSDYTGLVVSKFLHGLDSPRAPYLAFRSHPLFAKWRELHFDALHNVVNGLLQKGQR